MRIFLMLITWYISSPVGLSRTWTEKDRQVETEQVSLWEGKLAEAEELDPGARIPHLWLGLRNMGYRKAQGEYSAGVEKIYRRLQRQLLSIPGHAEYFGREVKRLTDEEFSGKLTEHSSTRGWYFQTLKELPSEETVRVLGELLFDERNLDGDASTDSPYVPNSVNAAYIFHDLGLKNPPVGGKYGDAHEDLSAWTLWYGQVRAGKRTFSFKGDDTVYSLNGPVSKAAAGQGEQAGKAPTVPGSRQPTNSSKLPSLIALGLVLVCIVAWFVMRMKRRPA